MKLKTIYKLLFVIILAISGLSVHGQSVPTAANQVNVTDGAGGWVLTPFSSGGVPPSPPNYSVQAYEPGGTLTSDPNITINTTTHNLDAFAINNIVNLASQSGSGSTAQFNQWIADVIASGQRSFLWGDPQAASGPPTSALTSLTRVIDGRGTNCMDQDGTFTFADNSLCFEAGEDSQDSTTQTTDKADIHVGYNSRKGGVYNANNLGSGTKSNRSAIALNADFQTASQKWGIYGIINSLAGGETIGYSEFLQEYGGYLGYGQEASEGVRIQQQQAAVTDGVGGVWKATVSSITGTTASFTSPTNAFTLGETRIIRDLGTSYSTGSISNVVCNEDIPNTCTVTGSGTTWTSITGFVATHTTWNGLTNAGPIINSNLTLCFAPNANDGYDWCVPITAGISDTSLTVNLYDVSVGQDAPWYGPLSGSYVIYHSAWPTSVDTDANTFSAGDISGITSGDTVDQVQAYNGNFDGMLILQQRHIGRPYFGGGLTIQNYSSSTAPAFNYGVDVNGAYEYGLQLGGNYGTPLYGIFSGFGGATRIPVWMADFTTPSTTPINFFEYFRSDSAVQVAMQFDTNVADQTEGFELYPNLIPVPFNVSSKGVVTLPAISGNLNVGSVYNTEAGVLGEYQNQLLYSQFDSASIGSTWITYAATPASTTANTTDVTDPNGGNTAEKFVAPSSFGSFVYSGQQQYVTLTSGLPYTASICFRGAAGGEYVIWGLSTSPYDAGLSLTTSWQCVSTSKTTSGSVAPGFLWATGTPSATIYVAFAQLEQNVSKGYYIHTIATDQPITYGFSALSILSPELRSGVSTNTDITGTLTLSGGSATYNFAGTYATAPNCFTNDKNATPTLSSATTTTTVLTIHGTGSDTIGYMCVGLN